MLGSFLGGVGLFKSLLNVWELVSLEIPWFIIIIKTVILTVVCKKKKEKSKLYLLVCWGIDKLNNTD